MAIRGILSFLILSWAPVSAALDYRQGLASDPYWLALGHYRESAVWSGTYRSAVNDANFFLAPDGEQNPAAELDATIRSLQHTDINHPSVCRFPARYRWLSEKLGDADFSERYTRQLRNCPQYQEWRKNIQAHSAVLIYASSHLNSPSSMYGHTLLRVDPPQMESRSTPLLSWGVSFAANIPPDDNSILYAFNGIFGGYPGLFSMMPYYDKLKEYSYMENRDVWEYSLNLSPSEVERMMDHVWELNNIRFRYFFFDENCSYRLLELLEIARPGQGVTEGYAYAVIPVDTVRGIERAGLISRVDYRPSVSTRLRSEIAHTRTTEQNLALRISSDVSYLDSEAYGQFSGESQARTAHLAYDYLRYQVRKSPRDEEIAKSRYRLLTEINRLPGISFPDPPVPVRPELGHESGALTMAAGREASQDYADLELRLSFHELEDNVRGYLPGSAINMGRFKFRHYDSENFELQQLDVIDIDSLSPRNDFFKPISWRSSMGFERYRTADKDQGVMQVNGGGGVTYEIQGSLLFYALGTARAEYNESFEDNWQAAAGAASGLIHFSSWGRWHFGADAYEFFNGYQRSQVFLTAHLDLGKDNGLELQAGHHHYDDVDFDRIEFSWRHYF